MNDEILKKELSNQKIKLIEKYSLTCSDEMIWEFRHDKYHTVKYFSHKFAQKESVLALLFYINRLCYAKIKYFDKSFSKEDINEVLSNCDIVISTIPSTKETYKLMNEEKFAVMKENSSFINVGRGNVVDEEDLLKYASKFRGIALDVFEQEPLNQSSELWNLENIIITPHNSWVSDQNHERSFNLFYNNLKRYISGKNPENIVEIEKGY